MPETPGNHDRARLLTLATTASVATAGVLIAVKLVAWLLTGSVSVLASLIDSLMDAAASLINFFAVRYSLTPADDEHRFGHGKAESLAGLAQAAFIAGSAVFLVMHAIDRMLHPRPIEAMLVGIAVMIFAIVATLVLLAIQRYVVRRTGSMAIRADSLHYMTDVLTNVSIIAALLFVSFGWESSDSIFAIGIAAYILYSAWQIAHDAFHLLMDRELPEEERQGILQVVQTHAQVCGVHDLRTRQSGATKFVQLHLELDEDLSLKAAHSIGDEVVEAICAAFPTAHVTIHQDPVSSRQHAVMPAP
ncbi:MAG: cation diffusion facilitator family transporter [Gammaproteobacteria bacterium]